MKSLKKILLRRDYIFVPMELSPTNHLEVRATINGAPGRFILDTGASNTCVALDKSEHFKLISKSSDIRAAGAGTKDLETMISESNTIEIGDWRYDSQNIVLFDLIHVNEALVAHEAKCVDGIIGSDILDYGEAIIDYKSKKLFLKKNN